MIDIWTNPRSHSDKRDISVFAIWSKIQGHVHANVSSEYLLYFYYHVKQLKALFPHVSQNSLPIYL